MGRLSTEGPLPPSKKDRVLEKDSETTGSPIRRTLTVPTRSERSQESGCSVTTGPGATLGQGPTGGRGARQEGRPSPGFAVSEEIPVGDIPPPPSHFPPSPRTGAGRHGSGCDRPVCGQPTVFYPRRTGSGPHPINIPRSPSTPQVFIRSAKTGLWVLHPLRPHCRVGRNRVSTGEWEPVGPGGVEEYKGRTGGSGLSVPTGLWESVPLEVRGAARDLSG